MVTETDNYPDETSYNLARLRSGPRHTAGFRGVNYNRNPFSITWTNDPEPPQPPPRPLTQRDFIDELAAERGVSII